MSPTPLTSSRRERLLKWGVPLLLALFTAAIWCVQHRRTTPADWQYPLTFTGDTMEILVRLKAVSEGDPLSFFSQKMDRLGAPFGADWSEYPVSDRLLFFVFGNIARVTGLNVASNLAVLMAAVTSALSFYGCARYLRSKRLWCFVGALLFAFTYQAAFRRLAHLWLAYSYTVPLALLTSWLLASSKRLSWRSGSGKLCLATSAILGVSNPYNLYLFLQLIGFSFLANLIHKQRRRFLPFCAVCIFVSLGAWALFQGSSLITRSEERPVAAISRNYSGTELYALKPVDLFVPPANHHSTAMASIGHRYLRWAAIKGETFYPYLGVTCIAGLVWLIFECVRRVSQRKKLSAHGPQTGWIVLFSVPGGINSLLALFLGLQIFRATNRFSIFISCLVLLFMVSRASRFLRRWPAWVKISLAATVLIFGLWDQLPTRTPENYFAQTKKVTDSDAGMGRTIDTQLPAHAMIFQLPVEDFPEAPPESGMPEYEHFRPYLQTTTARFTYGVVKHHAIGQWQHDYEKLPPAALAQALERIGFAGIFIDRRGYPDRGTSLVKALQETGRKVIWDQDEFVVVALTPSANPQLPVAAQFTFGQGWYNIPDGERWAFENAYLSFYNPLDRPLEASMRFNVIAPDERVISVKTRNTTLLSKKATPEPTIISSKLMLQPGINVLALASDTPAIRVSEARYGLRAFGISNLTLELTSEPSLKP
jgi:hypothetical protein